MPNPSRQCGKSDGRVRVRAMRRTPFFFAYFWASPSTGGWTNVRT